MYKTNNKLESVNLIKTLKLNTFKQKVFEVKYTTDEDVNKFLNANNCAIYAIRDNTTSNSSIRTHAASKDEILNVYKKFDNCTISESINNYINNQTLIGNIVVGSDGSVIVEGTNHKCDSVREAMNNANIRLNTTIDDNRIEYVNGLKDIVDYVIEHNLQDMVVEFSTFNKNVGINNEKVIIYELRSNY